MKNRYNEVMGHIKNMINNGSLRSGSRVPSIRQLCSEFKCNKATVIRAYNELQKQHMLYSKPKSGYYVVEKDVVKENDDNFTIDFSSASPDPEILPYQEFQHSTNQAIKIYKHSLFSYSDTQGLIGLRKALHKHFTNSQVFASHDNIFITSGSQQALFLLSRMPFPNGRTNVLVEQPTYIGALKALEYNNITAIGIERTSEGVDMYELERIFRSGNIKFFYSIPRFHNPTGFSYTNEQKKQILSLALKYDIYIVEDDYLADLEMDTKSDPIYSMGMPQRVIYLKSFSKLLLPGLRIGAAVIPNILSGIFGRYKMCCDILTNVLSQGALEVYLKSGMFDSHIKQIKKYYSGRMECLKAAFNTITPQNVNCFVPSTGFFSCVTLPSSIKAKKLLKILEAKNILAVDIENWFLPEFERDNMLRLSICRTDSQKIYEGIRVISDAIQNSSIQNTTSRKFALNSFY